MGIFMGMVEAEDEVAKAGGWAGTRPRRAIDVRSLKVIRSQDLSGWQWDLFNSSTASAEWCRDTDTISCIGQQFNLQLILVAVVLMLIEVSRPSPQWWAVIRAQTNHGKKIDHPEKGLCLPTNTLTTRRDGKGDTGKMSGSIGNSQTGKCFPYLPQLWSFRGCVSATCDGSIFYGNDPCAEIFFPRVAFCTCLCAIENDLGSFNIGRNEHTKINKDIRLSKLCP